MRIQKYSLNWITSYLNVCQQYVSLPKITKNSIETCTSHYLSSTVGVPQGSIMGPILFLIYINDIVLVNLLTHFTLYADDTSLLVSDKCQSVVEENCNILLAGLYNWFCINSLYLNAGKTQAIQFHHRQKQLQFVDLKINNESIKCVSYENFWAC